MWLTVLRCALYSVALFIMIGNFLQIYTGKYPNLLVALAITAGLQSLSFILAKIGFWERYFALLHRARPAGSRELARLTPLIDEVGKIGGVRPKHVLVSPLKEVNAMALGRNTLVIHKGIMEKMNDEQLKAIIGHELGHLKNGDSQRRLIEYAFSAASDFIVWCVSIVFAFLNGATEGAGFALNPVGLFIVGICLVAAIFLWGLILPALLAKFIDNRILYLFALKQSREAEYRADAFGASVSSPAAMLSALEVLENEYGEQALNFFERLLQTHPPLGYRLDRLHEMVQRDKEIRPALAAGG